MSYIDDQAAGWIDIGDFHREYDHNPIGQKPETADGPGSTLAHTEHLQAWFGELLRRHLICSVLDAACGDWNWMRLVDLGNTEYTGWDVDPGRIESAVAAATDELREPPRPERQGASLTFECVNLLTVAEIPYHDLILCRDFLVHITNEHVQTLIDKIRAGGSLLLLASTFPGADNTARQWRPEEATWRGYMETPLDLTTEPFNLGEPIETLDEAPCPWGSYSQPRQLALWRLQ